ncbi:MAG: Rne/Rng family ribonuclease [Planctomycetes bacterium]|nr:Rne/Rng family ribonuclease [Planctomycetota bacterium]
MAVNQRDPEEIRIALHEGSRLVDLRWAREDRPTKVGNIYMAVVRQVEAGLDAAFIDFGDRRAGFLHRGNVHPAYEDESLSPLEVAALPSRQAAMMTDCADEGDEPDADSGDGEDFVEEAAPRIEDLLRPGQQILVQVLRDPVRGKGATLTTIISLPGRQAVLVPSLGRIGVSRRIHDSARRATLRELFESTLEGTGLGAIARTAAEDAPDDEIRADLAPLREAWQSLGQAVADVDAPILLYEEAGPATRAVRELLGPNVERVVVDNKGAADSVRSILDRYLPGHSLQIESYEERRPLFEILGIERDWQMLFRSRVPVGAGASIVIHETEALTAIDVNSGRVDKGSLEETALEANRLAAEEMARQIRLRDLGGIIVADFIDMQKSEHRRELERTMRAALKADRARLKLGRMSSFGLLAMTRRRQGAGLPRASDALCLHCGGSGHIGHHNAGALRLLRRLRALEPGPTFRIRLHPGVEQAFERDYSGVCQELGLELVFESDPQVPSGEPVVEALAGSAVDR